MPEVLVASGDGLDAGSAMVEGEVERNHAVATCSISFHERGRMSTIGIGDAMPSEAVAGGDGRDASVAMIDGEVECDHAVATHRIEHCELRSESGGGVKGVVPEVLVACSDSLRASGAVIEGQIERVDIGTAGARLAMVESIDPRQSVINIVPLIVVASHYMVCGVVVQIDSEVERVGACTAVGIGIVILVYA